MNWREFKPTILFLVKFLGIYLIGNLLYGWYVTTFEPRADPITREVTIQTARALTALGWPCEVEHAEARSTTLILFGGKSIVAVYEGCNGINVMIIFVAFVLAISRFTSSMVWFIPAGIVAIHVINLTRIALLFVVALQMPSYLYFSHKYLFTAFIYAFVLLLWMIWVRIMSTTK